MLFELLNLGALGVKPAASAGFARFTLEHGLLAGQTFIAGLRVCENPCCPCEAVGFACRPARQHDAGAAAPESAPYGFDLDVFTRQVNTGIQPTPDSETLARGVAAEMQEPDWQRLADLFLNTKRRVMKTMDINAVRAQFPAEVMTGGGSMVGYVEIFPWAEPWEFQLGADSWLADDQYCVRAGCTCTHTALTFFRLPKRAPFWRNKVTQVASLRYDYVSRVTEPIKSKPRNPAAGELMQALQGAYPDFGKTLRQRHGQLKQLGRRLLSKSSLRTWRAASAEQDVELDAATEAASLQPPAPQTVRALPRPGRNDPCPCGSGKKFKKCCGGS